MWADTAAALTALRQFLNDGPTDRPVKSKQIIGPANGVNKVFFTWEDRLITGTVSTIVNDTVIAEGANLAVNQALGQLTYLVAPPPSAAIVASYFFQYFTDAELTSALTAGLGQISDATLVTNVPNGLQQAVLCFAGYFAYYKQAMRWAQRMSERFILQDAPLDSETLGRSNLFRQMANDLYKQAREMREDYYTQQGRREQPAWTVVKPYIPVIGPRR